MQIVMTCADFNEGNVLATTVERTSSTRWKVLVEVEWVEE